MTSLQSMRKLVATNAIITEFSLKPLSLILQNQRQNSLGSFLAA